MFILIVTKILESLPDIIWLIRRRVETGEKRKIEADARAFKGAIVAGDSDTISRLLAEKVAEARAGRAGG